MNLATLRVHGTDAALHLLRSVLPIVADDTWSQGQKRRNGGFFTSSGFSVTVADQPNPDAMVASIRTFIADCQRHEMLFRDPGISAELAIGVTVGEDDQFVACVDLSHADLYALASLRIALSIAAYPSSDEDHVSALSA